MLDPAFRNPAGESCPGSAYPAEAIAFTSLFSSFFSLQLVLAAILPTAFPRNLPGTPKSQKIRLFAQKVVPRTQVLSVFRSIYVFHTFGVDLWFVFHEKTIKKPRNSCTAALVFFELTTLTILCILRYESHFPCFCFYHVFR